ncbi:hypothetical protein QCA50_016334 [Cerrena zonata]|uniref:LEC14B protein n=1 Tax=Cerrena zonata TaxID=2478898 RepID=A0AAW0FSN6_9APHY
MLEVRILSYLAAPRHLGLRFPTGGIYSGEGVEEDGTFILDAGPQGRIRITPVDLLQYLSASESNGQVGNEEDEEEDEDYQFDEEDDDDDIETPILQFHDSSKPLFEPVTKPVAKGLELLMGGEFGRLGHQYKSRRRDDSGFAQDLYEDTDSDSPTETTHAYSHNFARTLLNRSSRLRPTYKEDIANEMIPNSNGTAVAQYSSNAYVGQYSSDSSFYYTCVRDFRLHIYDTTAPIQPADETSSKKSSGHSSTMKVIKEIPAHADNWTITDSHLSPDNQRMIYATVSDCVYMTSTLDSSNEHVAINFSDPVARQRRFRGFGYDDSYGIWSCKFSADGNEIVAGGRHNIFVYDLLANRRTVNIFAHDDDINSCCWADTAGNILVSASDDSFLKVWDRRSLGESQDPSGVLIGHTEGITYVSAKGDGRYVISNGKDQILRLWDLRCMRSNLDYQQVKGRSYGLSRFDYRTDRYPSSKTRKHPMDCSVMKYTGHEVLRTLIRCHFSPTETTGNQYIYSGSADGKIHIWSLDGRVVQTLDRSKTLPMFFDPSGEDREAVGSRYKRVTVRDLSWHSQQPIMMSTGWLGDAWRSREGSVIARHEWKGLSKMRYKLEDHVEKQRAEQAEAMMPGSYTDSDSE